VPSEHGAWDEVNDRVTEIKLKTRSTLTLGELFELSRACPQDLDGQEMENKIRDVMSKCVTETFSKVNVCNEKCNAVVARLTGFEVRY